MFRKLLVLVGAVCALATLPASAQQGVARAPLDLFVGYDTLREPDLSPNGRYVALVRREPVGDVLIIFDRQTRQSQAIQTARADQQMRIDFVSFKTDDRIVFGFSQKVHVIPAQGSARVGSRADDAFEWVSRVYASDITGANRISLYDPSTQSGLPRWVNAQIADMLPRDDNNVLMVAPKAGGAELWRIDVRTGEHSTVDRGGLYTFNWVVDSEGVPVLRQDIIANGRGYAWSRRGRGQNSWTEIIRFRGAEGANSGPTFQGLGPAVNPGQVFVLARRDGEDTSGLYVYDAGTGQYTETVQTNPEFDVSSAIRDLDNNVILAACWWGLRWECEPKDQTFGRYWSGIVQALGPNLNVRLEARGGERGEQWLLRTNGPQDLGTYRIYNTETRQLATLFTVRPTADPALLPTQRVIEYTARDGTRLWGYLWIPPGVTNVRNLPTIVVPHGGPEGRDVWGFDPFAMTFASQGYAVFQPNFRGGGGFGRRFVEAGHRQWGLRMQDDVVDGARHLIQQGITDANRICITGWSYGGYVAMTAAFQNADVFKCSVAGAGVSDMVAMQRWVRAGPRDADVASGGGQGSQSMSYRYWTEAMGDPDSDRATMDAHSAAQNAARVGMPLLLIHGEEDETVPIEQSQLMVRAMERAGKPVRLVELADTNHYFRPDQAEAWRTVFTESLAFYQQNIGPGVAPGSQ